MKKALLLLLLCTNLIAASFEGEVGQTTKVIDKGVASIENATYAVAKAQVSSFGGAVHYFHNKRLDLAVNYLFTSDLADLHVGVLYRNFSKGTAIANARDSLEPYVVMNGNIFKKFPWELKGEFNLRDRTNNFEARVSVPFGWTNFMVMPTIGIGANDPGSYTIQALQDARTYYISSIELQYMTVIGNACVGYERTNDINSFVLKYLLKF